MLSNTNLSKEAATLTKWLVSIPSVAHAKGPALICQAIHDGLAEFPYFKKHNNKLHLIEHKDSTKSSVVALVKALEEVEETIVLLCDTDTTSPYHYGMLKGFSTNCDELRNRLLELEDLSDDALKDGLFGLGVLQSKCATGSMLVALKELSDNHVRLNVNILFICTSESAIQHRGIKKCIPFIQELIDQEHLKLRLAINAKPNFPLHRKDQDLHIFTGNYGKVEPSFYIIGNSTASFKPYSGFSASIIASELIRELELNAKLTQRINHAPLVPTFDSLRVKEFGKEYSPDGMQISFSLPIVNLDLTDLLEVLKDAAAKAIEHAADLVDQREALYAHINQEDFHPQIQDAEVVSFSDLLERASHNFTGNLQKALAGMVQKCRSEGLSLHQASITIIERLNELAKLPRPSVVVYFTDNFLPPQGLSASLSQDREIFMILDDLLNRFAQNNTHSPNMANYYAPSDACLMRPINIKSSLKTLRQECPVGVEELESLNVPTITLGVKGDNLTLLTEYVDKSMFEYLPSMILSIVDALGENPVGSYQDLELNLENLAQRAENIASAAINEARSVTQEQQEGNSFYTQLSQGTLEPQNLDTFLKQQQDFNKNAANSKMDQKLKEHILAGALESPDKFTLQLEPTNSPEHSLESATSSLSEQDPQSEIAIQDQEHSATINAPSSQEITTAQAQSDSQDKFTLQIEPTNSPEHSLESATSSLPEQEPQSEIAIQDHEHSAAINAPSSQEITTSQAQSDNQESTSHSLSMESHIDLVIDAAHLEEDEAERAALAEKEQEQANDIQQAIAQSINNDAQLNQELNKADESTLLEPTKVEVAVVPEEDDEELEHPSSKFDKLKKLFKLDNSEQATDDITPTKEQLELPATKIAQEITTPDQHEDTLDLNALASSKDESHTLSEQKISSDNAQETKKVVSELENQLDDSSSSKQKSSAIASESTDIADLTADVLGDDSATEDNQQESLADTSALDLSTDATLDSKTATKEDPSELSSSSDLLTPNLDKEQDLAAPSESSLDSANLDSHTQSSSCELSAANDLSDKTTEQDSTIDAAQIEIDPTNSSSLDESVLLKEEDLDSNSQSSSCEFSAANDLSDKTTAQDSTIDAAQIEIAPTNSSSLDESVLLKEEDLDSNSDSTSCELPAANDLSDKTTEQDSTIDAAQIEIAPTNSSSLDESVLLKEKDLDSNSDSSSCELSAANDLSDKTTEQDSTIDAEQIEIAQTNSSSLDESVLLNEDLDSNSDSSSCELPAANDLSDKTTEQDSTIDAAQIEIAPTNSSSLDESVLLKDDNSVENSHLEQESAKQKLDNHENTLAQESKSHPFAMVSSFFKHFKFGKSHDKSAPKQDALKSTLGVEDDVDWLNTPELAHKQTPELNASDKIKADPLKDLSVESFKPFIPVMPQTFKDLSAKEEALIEPAKTELTPQDDASEASTADTTSKIADDAHKQDTDSTEAAFDSAPSLDADINANDTLDVVLDPQTSEVSSEQVADLLLSSIKDKFKSNSLASIDNPSDYQHHDLPLDNNVYANDINLDEVPVKIILGTEDGFNSAAQAACHKGNHEAIEAEIVEDELENASSTLASQDEQDQLSKDEELTLDKDTAFTKSSTASQALAQDNAVETTEAVDNDTSDESSEAVENDTVVESSEDVEDDSAVESSEDAEDDSAVETSEVAEDDTSVETTEDVEDDTVVDSSEAVEDDSVVDSPEAAENDNAVESSEAVEDDTVVDSNEVVEDDTAVDSPEVVEDDNVVETTEDLENDSADEPIEVVEDDTSVEPTEAAEDDTAVESSEAAENDTAVDSSEDLENDSADEPIEVVEDDTSVEPTEAAEDDTAVESSEAAENDTAVDSSEDVEDDSVVESSEAVENDSVVESSEAVENDTVVESSEAVEHDTSVDSSEDAENDTADVPTEDVKNDSADETSEDAEDDTVVETTEAAENDTSVESSEDAEDDTAVESSEAVENDTAVESSEAVETDSADEPTEVVENDTVVDSSEAVEDDTSVEPTEAVENNTVVETTEDVENDTADVPTEAVEDDNADVPTEAVEDDNADKPTEAAEDDSIVEPSEAVEDDSVDVPNEVVKDDTVVESSEIVEDDNAVDSSEVVENDTAVDSSEAVEDDTADEPSEAVENDSVVEPSEDVETDSADEPTEDAEDDTTFDSSEAVEDDTAVEPTKDAENDSVVESSEDVENESADEPTEAVENDTVVETTEDAENDSVVDSSEDVDNDTSVESSEDVKNDSAVETNEDVEDDTVVDSSEAVENDIAVESSEDAENDTAVDSPEVVEDDTAVEPSENVENDSVVETTEDVEDNSVVVPTEAVEDDNAVESSEDVESDSADEPIEVVETDSTDEPTEAVEDDTAVDSSKDADDDTAVESSDVVETDSADEPSEAVKDDDTKLEPADDVAQDNLVAEAISVSNTKEEASASVVSESQQNLSKTLEQDTSTTHSEANNLELESGNKNHDAARADSTQDQSSAPDDQQLSGDTSAQLPKQEDKSLDDKSTSEESSASSSSDSDTNKENEAKKAKAQANAQRLLAIQQRIAKSNSNNLKSKAPSEEKKLSAMEELSLRLAALHSKESTDSLKSKIAAQQQQVQEDKSKSIKVTLPSDIDLTKAIDSNVTMLSKKSLFISEDPHNTRDIEEVFAEAEAEAAAKRAEAQKRLASLTKAMAEERAAAATASSPKASLADESSLAADNPSSTTQESPNVTATSTADLQQDSSLTVQEAQSDKQQVATLDSKAPAAIAQDQELIATDNVLEDSQSSADSLVADLTNEDKSTSDAQEKAALTSEHNAKELSLEQTVATKDTTAQESILEEKQAIDETNSSLKVPASNTEQNTTSNAAIAQSPNTQSSVAKPDLDKLNQLIEQAKAQAALAKQKANLAVTKDSQDEVYPNVGISSELNEQRKHSTHATTSTVVDDNDPTVAPLDEATRREMSSLRKINPEEAIAELLYADEDFSDDSDEQQDNLAARRAALRRAMYGDNKKERRLPPNNRQRVERTPSTMEAVRTSNPGVRILRTPNANLRKAQREQVKEPVSPTAIIGQKDRLVPEKKADPEYSTAIIGQKERVVPEKGADPEYSIAIIGQKDRVVPEKKADPKYSTAIIGQKERVVPEKGADPEYSIAIIGQKDRVVPEKKADPEYSTAIIGQKERVVPEKGADPEYSIAIIGQKDRVVPEKKADPEYSTAIIGQKERVVPEKGADPEYSIAIIGQKDRVVPEKKADPKYSTAIIGQKERVVPEKGADPEYSIAIIGQKDRVVPEKKADPKYSTAIIGQKERVVPEKGHAPEYSTAIIGQKDRVIPEKSADPAYSTAIIGKNNHKAADHKSAPAYATAIIAKNKNSEK